MMKDENNISRRNFIQRIGVLGAAGFGASSLLAACGGGETSAPAEPAAPAAEPAPEPATADALTCQDTTGLTEQEIQMRTSLNYVDETDDPERACDKCALYQTAEEGACGGCTLIKGPIHPNGTCTSFAPKPPSA